MKYLACQNQVKIDQSLLITYQGLFTVILVFFFPYFIWPLGSNDRRAFIEAARYNNDPAIIQQLIDNGADVNERDGYGKTALIECCSI